jgi:hypothetical protein
VPIRLTQAPRCRMFPCAGIEVGIGRGLGAARDAEQRAEGVERVETPIEAERELVEIGLEMLRAHAMVDAVEPGLQVGEDEVDHRHELFGNLVRADAIAHKVAARLLGERLELGGHSSKTPTTETPRGLIPGGSEPKAGRGMEISRVFVRGMCARGPNLSAHLRRSRFARRRTALASRSERSSSSTTCYFWAITGSSLCVRPRRGTQKRLTCWSGPAESASRRLVAEPQSSASGWATKRRTRRTVATMRNAACCPFQT